MVTGAPEIRGPDGATTPTSEAPADAVETHISLVLFSDERVYKLKKPIETAFLDYSTREKRLEACRKEVELNRRLAPDVYLGVADLVLGEEVLDHLVVMKRLPRDRSLSRLVEAGEVSEDHIRDIARRVAAFHAAAPTSREISEDGSWQAVRARWRDNFEELIPFISHILDRDSLQRVRRLAWTYTFGRKALFDSRVERGFIRDCHGDLLAEDIYVLDDGPRIIDCIEFDDRLRHIDVVDDIAFLAMDLGRLDRPDLGEALQRYYREFSAESHPGTLFHHYAGYRALVRSKVACLKGQPDPARRLLEIAEGHLRKGRVFLVAIGGLPGSGKSALSRALAGKKGWAVVVSDEVRKELAGLPPAADARETFGEGIYSPRHTAETYEEIFRRAAALLEMGEPVILDASFADPRWRLRVAALAEETMSKVLEVECSSPAEVREGRIEERLGSSGDVSDATVEVSREMGAGWTPWDGAERLDTSGELQVAASQLEMLIER